MPLKAKQDNGLGLISVLMALHKLTCGFGLSTVRSSQ